MLMKTFSTCLCFGCSNLKPCLAPLQNYWTRFFEEFEGKSEFQNKINLLQTLFQNSQGSQGPTNLSSSWCKGPKNGEHSWLLWHQLYYITREGNTTCGGTSQTGSFMVTWLFEVWLFIEVQIFSLRYWAKPLLQAVQLSDCIFKADEVSLWACR